MQVSEDLHCPYLILKHLNRHTVLLPVVILPQGHSCLQCGEPTAAVYWALDGYANVLDTCLAIACQACTLLVQHNVLALSCGMGEGTSAPQ